MKKGNDLLIAREQNSAESSGWFGWAVYRTTTWKTTWKLRFLLSVLFLGLIFLARSWWIPAAGRGLVSGPGPGKPDLILVDNLVSDYGLFKKAAELMRGDGVKMVLVPVRSSNRDPDEPDRMAGEITQIMIRDARLPSCRLLPFRQAEPFTLHVARRVGRFLQSRREIHSVLIVTEGFRSRRTRLVYGRVLGKFGVKVCTYPVWGSRVPESWAKTWHGRQEVLLQYLKLLYYEFLLFHSPQV
ncbi:MAG: hypothetical protein ACP5SH_02275 [Syntrophobacteraceae bacterium]